MADGRRKAKKPTQKEWHDAIHQFRTTSGELREQVLGLLDYRAKARVAFALAPCELLVRVTTRGMFRTNPTPVTATQARNLRNAGVEVDERESIDDDTGKPAKLYSLRGLNTNEGDAWVETQRAWKARCAVDKRIAGWVAESKIEVNAYTEAESRDHALRVHFERWDSARDSAQHGGGGVPMPDLPSF